MTEEGKTLWTNDERTRFFLVPDGVVLFDGTFVIRDLLGHSKRVAEEALAPFAVPKETADEHLRAQLRSVVGSVKEIVAGLALQAKQKIPAPPEEIRPGVEAFSKGLRDFLGGLAGAVEQAAAAGSSAPSSVDSAVRKGSAELSAKLNEVLASPELAQLVQSAATKLQEITDRLNGPPPKPTEPESR